MKTADKIYRYGEMLCCRIKTEVSDNNFSKKERQKVRLNEA